MNPEFRRKHLEWMKQWRQKANLEAKGYYIGIMPEKAPKAPRKIKSSLQLKRERIAKNLAKIEERARIFREKLLKENNIADAPKSETTDESTADKPRSDRTEPDRESTIPIGL